MNPLERSQLSERPPSAEPAKAKTAVDKAAQKMVKREAKRAIDARRPLTSWERYRALMDAFEEGLELVNLADHKARFAFVIMGALNVALVVLAQRTDLLDRVPFKVWPWLVAYMLIYAVVAIHFFLQAIESLRPRSVRPVVPRGGDVPDDDYPLGVRFFHDVIERDVVSHLKAWREIRMSQLNAEIARQAYALARINRMKYAALNRLYAGLKVMTLLAAGLVILAFGVIIFDTFLRSDPAGTGVAASHKPLDILGAPAVMALREPREPSGIVYHAALGHLFLVGDEGRLVEMDLSGRVLRSDPVKGNLEDLTVHTPSGDLVLLAEKKSELIVFDPIAHQERKRLHLDTGALIDRAALSPPGVGVGPHAKNPKALDKNQGFEGLTFRPDAGLPGGGVFYLVHQRQPPLIIALAFDPGDAADPIDGAAVLKRIGIEGFKDLTAATYVPSLDRLLVISDQRQRLLVLSMEGIIEAALVLPGRQQEGVTVDAFGDLWIADEKVGVMRFAGAQKTLAAALGRRGAP